MGRLGEPHERVDLPAGLRKRVVLVSALIAALCAAAALMAAGVLSDNALDWLPCRGGCSAASEADGEDFGPTGTAISVAALAAMAVLSLVLGYRLQRCGVDVSATRVRVRAVLRDRTLQRQAVEGIHTASAWWPTLWWVDAAGRKHSMLLAGFAQSRDTPLGLADAIDERLDRLAELLGDLG